MARAASRRICCAAVIALAALGVGAGAAQAERGDDGDGAGATLFVSFRQVCKT